MDHVGTSTSPFSTSSASKTSDSLQGWAEIAAYLKRGVRTAQRWELTAGLPIHRLWASDRGPVFALPKEIDAWLRSRPFRNS
jgi:hypothetical protein